MAKTLLRSGNLDDFQSVGGGGQAIFTSALQIRETLRLQKRDALVACLAVPQVNDDGDRVDWYAPQAGKVVAWKSADSDMQQRALAELTALAAEAAELSEACQRSPTTARRLFGALLEKALQFPGPGHVFLVDGRPTIAFWGFVNLNEPIRESPFACLQPALPEPTPPLAKPAPTAPEPASAPLEQTPARRKRRMTPARAALLGLPLAAAAAAALLAPDLLSDHRKPGPPAEAVIVSAPQQPLLSSTLPLRPATVTEPVNARPPEPEVKTVILAAVPGDALVMEADRVRAGTTGFLNGRWRVVLDAKDAASGRPPSLRYQIKNNKGTARLVHGDSVVCKADVFSGLHSNGELQIKSRGLARCSDGSRYPLPQITCTAGTSGVARCSGRYDANTVIPLTFHKVGR